MPRSSTSGTATIERGTYWVCSAKARPKRGSRATSEMASAWPGREDVADEAAVGRDLEADDALALGAGRDPEDEHVAGRVEEGERRGLGLEQEDGGLDDRAEDGLGAAELEAPGDLGAPADRRERLAGGGEVGRVRGVAVGRGPSSLGGALQALEVGDDERRPSRSGSGPRR